MVSQWYETYFQGMAVELWTAAVTDDMTNPEVAFLEQQLHLEAEASVLDVPCGSGRHAVALAKRGYRLTGVDLSEGFLEIARQNSDIEWIHADMRNLPCRTFHAAYCMGNSFGYLDHAGTVTFLRCVAESLRPDGRFVLETGTVAEALLPAFQPKSEYEFGGIRLRVDREYDCLHSRYLGTYTFERGEEVEVRRMDQAVYTSGEIVRLLEQAGFTVEQLHGGPDGKPFALGSRRLLVTARKSGST